MVVSFVQTFGMTDVQVVMVIQVLNNCSRELKHKIVWTDNPKGKEQKEISVLEDTVIGTCATRLLVPDMAEFGFPDGKVSPLWKVEMNYHFDQANARVKVITQELTKTIISNRIEELFYHVAAMVTGQVRDEPISEELGCILAEMRFPPYYVKDGAYVYDAENLGNRTTEADKAEVSAMMEMVKGMETLRAVLRYEILKVLGGRFGIEIPDEVETNMKDEIKLEADLEFGFVHAEAAGTEAVENMTGDTGTAEATAQPKTASRKKKFVPKSFS